MANARERLVGQRFGRLVAIGYSRAGEETKWPRWKCRCDCGNTSYTTATALVKGHARSCGCLQRESRGKSSRSHGRTGTAEHRAWLGLKDRCLNPKNPGYVNYGGRGITVCSRWRDSSAAFLADVGERPSPKHSLDRIDNQKGYLCGKSECPDCGLTGEKPNCRWATRTQQVRNRRSSVLVTYQSETMPLYDWCERLNLPYSTVVMRLRDLGWEPAKAFMTPFRKQGGKRPGTQRAWDRGIWRKMVERCTDRDSHGYPKYGARGITVCARWAESFDDFISDMGVRPNTNLSLDRIDNDKGYWCGRVECPDCGPNGRTPNCRWATREQQQANKGVAKKPEKRQSPRVLVADENYTVPTRRYVSKMPEYFIWYQAKKRCEDERYDPRRLLIGKGIVMCSRWRESFENFLADMGRRPKDHFICRTDPSKGFEPGNCWWAPKSASRRFGPPTGLKSAKKRQPSLF